MDGFCSQCFQSGTVWRYRVWTQGLRWMHAPCFERLVAMGLDIQPVTAVEPRQSDRGRSARRHPGFGTRHIAAGLRWLMAS